MHVIEILPRVVLFGTKQNYSWKLDKKPSKIAFFMPVFLKAVFHPAELDNPITCFFTNGGKL
jgi:hypothetical protein